MPHARLQRFVAAQDGGGSYAAALDELRQGGKVTHWMWYVFPQLTGLGRSEAARYFGIEGLAEARAYLRHPQLGPRLQAVTQAILEWAGRRPAEAILGSVDAMKLRSSMTLFERAAADVREAAPFSLVLDTFFIGERDTATAHPT